MADAVVTLGLDSTPFMAGINRAEAQAKSFTRNVGASGSAMWDFMGGGNTPPKGLTTFQERLRGLFRRDPNARAGRALGMFVGDLASGDIQTAIASVATRLRGIGLAAGIGIGAAVIIFKNAKEQVDAVDKSVQNLNVNLARPLSLQSALGPEGISKEIENTSKSLDEIKEKRQGFFPKLLSYLQTAPEGSSFKRGGNQFQKELGVPQTRNWVTAQEAGEKRLHELSSKRADAELRAADIKRISLRDSEREGELQESSLKAQEKRSQLYLERGLTRPGRSAVDLFKSIVAVNQEEALSRQEIAKKFDLKKQEEEVENRILNLHATSLTKDQQSLVALRERINLLKQRLTEPGSAESKSAIGTQIHRLENQELAGQYAESKKPWQQKADEMNAQRDYRNFVARQTPSNPNAYLSNPAAYNRRDILGNKIDEAGNVIGPGGGGSDTQGVGLLGQPGVLDRIESKIDELGANR